jgi:lipoprotein-anchoring transpeptidase ErfK/SrfK
MRRFFAGGVLLAAAVLTASACSGGAVDRADAGTSANPRTPGTELTPSGYLSMAGYSANAQTPSSLGLPSSVAATSTTIEVVPAAPVIEAGAKGLGSGDKGVAVEQLEARLAQLRFSPGKADGRYDAAVVQAVMSFQKQVGLKRTGRADPETLTKLATAPLGAPMVTGEPTRVEIDLNRQIAQFWKDGKLIKVIAVSTGNGQRYCLSKEKGGGCDTAVTPGGSYRADRKIKGLRVSKLGELYDPVFFNGGIAIHGSGSVPASPASHGCVRVPMWESRWVHDNMEVGHPVYVVGGKIAPVPFLEGAPEGPDVETPAPQ